MKKHKVPFKYFSFNITTYCCMKKQNTFMNHTNIWKCDKIMQIFVVMGIKGPLLIRKSWSHNRIWAKTTATTVQYVLDICNFLVTNYICSDKKWNYLIWLLWQPVNNIVLLMTACIMCWHTTVETWWIKDSLCRTFCRI